VQELKPNPKPYRWFDVTTHAQVCLLSSRSRSPCGVDRPVVNEPCGRAEPRVGDITAPLVRYTCSAGAFPHHLPCEPTHVHSLSLSA
jgi:hypothetical protein